jgi:glutamyl-tRNA synthetase
MPSLKERAKTLNELAEGAAFLVRRRPLVLDASAANLLTGDAKLALSAFAEILAGLPEWRQEALEDEARQFAEARGTKLGKLAQPLRAALTGSTVSPPIFEVMRILGRDECLARIRDVV